MKFWNILSCVSVLIISQANAGQMIVGGYSAMPADAPEAVSIAKAAVKMKNALPESKKVKLLSIIDAQSQVVAGQNFKLCISVKQASHKVRVQTVVYRDLGGKLILTEWTPKGC